MSFKTRQIRKKPPLRLRPGRAFGFLGKVKLIPKPAFAGLKGPHVSVLRYVWMGLLLIFASWVVVKVTFGAYHLVTDFKTTAKEVVFSAATELKTDKYGYTNLALLGDGGFQRDGAGLVDTIMIASIDHKKNAVTLLSIPRDYYVGKNGIGIGKINELYVANRNGKGYEAYQDALGKIANLDVHYYVRVDFNAFVEIIDSLGGITVDVQQAIYDPQYPNARDTGFDPFRINAGVQEMDGETALKFARSRHNQYAPSGDFDRAARQQQILGAIQQKALSMDVLTSPTTLKNVYDAVESNMDTNMTWRELLALAEFGDQFDRSHLVMKVLTSYSGQEGGFLVDGIREIYGGSVLLPETKDLSTIHRYADLIFHHRELYFDPPKIQILNATRQSGRAGDLKSVLAQYGFNVVEISNYLDPNGERQYADETMLFYYSWAEEPASGRGASTGQVEPIPTYQAAIEVLSDFASFVPLPGNPHQLQDIDLTLVLGADYKEVLLD